MAERSSSQISSEERSKLEIFRAKWLAATRNCEPLTRDRARELVARVYSAAGKVTPDKIIFVKNPLEFFARACHLCGRDIATRSYVVGSTKAVLDSTLKSLAEDGPPPDSDYRAISEYAGERNHHFNLANSWWENNGLSTEVLRSLNFRQFEEHCIDIFENAASVSRRSAAFYGRSRGSQSLQLDCTRAALTLFLLRELEVGYSTLNPETLVNGVEALLELGSALLWPGTGVAIVCQRPRAIRVDGEGRLHCLDGPAVEWTNWKLHCVNGISVDEELWRDRKKQTHNVILSEVNINMRRVRLEMYGVGRWVASLLNRYVEVLDEDPRYGTLYRLRFHHRESPEERWVRVVNASPESDGTFQVFYIPVNIRCGTARVAVAWTFGLSGGQYEPAMET